MNEELAEPNRPQPPQPGIIRLSRPSVLVKTPIFETITVLRLEDSPAQRRVQAIIQDHNQAIVLWEDAAYDQIGDWTQSQAEARILEIISSINS